jgi:hypothetical protein
MHYCIAWLQNTTTRFTEPPGSLTLMTIDFQRAHCAGNVIMDPPSACYPALSQGAAEQTAAAQDTALALPTASQPPIITRYPRPEPHHAIRSHLLSGSITIAPGRWCACSGAQRGQRVV